MGFIITAHSELHNYGTSTISISLAAMMKKFYDNVLLIDTNFRQCDMSTYLGTSGESKGIDKLINLSSAIKDQNEILEIIKSYCVNIKDNLYMINSSSSTTIDYFCESKNVEFFISTLKILQKIFDLIIIDARVSDSLLSNAIIRNSDVILKILHQDVRLLNKVSVRPLDYINDKAINVINNYTDEFIPSLDEINNAYKINALALPRDVNLRNQAVLKSILRYLDDPETDYYTCMQDIIIKILEKIDKNKASELEQQLVDKRQNKKHGFFSYLKK